MAFELTIHIVEKPVSIVADGNARVAVVNFGHDAALDISYSLLVGLEPLPGGDMELFFAIVTDQNGRKNEFLSGRETKAILPDIARQSLMGFLLKAVRALVNHCKCNSIRFSTYEPDLPEKALVKYFLIANMIESCGYVIHKPNTYHGRYMWWAERQSD